MPSVAATNATGKCTIITWIGWPTSATAEPVSRLITSSSTGLCAVVPGSCSYFAMAGLLCAGLRARIIALRVRC